MTRQLIETDRPARQGLEGVVDAAKAILGGHVRGRIVIKIGSGRSGFVHDPEAVWRHWPG